jgi:hypothetical protein
VDQIPKSSALASTQGNSFSLTIDGELPSSEKFFLLFYFFGEGAPLNRKSS